LVERLQTEPQFRALLAAGQITMRTVDGWRTLAQKLVDKPIDRAA